MIFLLIQLPRPPFCPLDIPRRGYHKLEELQSLLHTLSHSTAMAMQEASADRMEGFAKAVLNLKSKGKQL